MLAIAAGLWFLYLLPTWLRRREYLATERTAVRLQQTMQARTSAGEGPSEVRLTETAREAARQERLLRAEQRRADAMALREARRVAAPSAESTAPAAVTVDADAVRRARMRRTRAGASILLLAATAIALVQIYLIATTGWSIGGALVLVASLGGVGLAVAVQRRLDRLTMPRREVVARRRAVTVPRYEVEEARVPWTPVELPKPLYLSAPSVPVAPAGPAAAAAASRADVEEALAAAVAESEQKLRAAQASPEVVPIRRDSKFAKMGVLDPTLTRDTDIDAALRRRRSAG